MQKAYQVEAHELSSCCRHSWNQIKKSTPKRRRTENYNSDDDQSNEDMIFIRPNSNLTSKISCNDSFLLTFVVKFLSSTKKKNY